MKPYSGTFAKVLKQEGFNGIPTSYYLLSKYFIKGDKEKPNVTERLADNDLIDIQGGARQNIIKPITPNIVITRDGEGFPIFDNLENAGKTGILDWILENDTSILFLKTDGVYRYTIATEVESKLNTNVVTGLIGFTVFQTKIYAYTTGIVYLLDPTNEFQSVRTGTNFRNIFSNATKMVISSSDQLHLFDGTSWSTLRSEYHTMSYSLNPLATPPAEPPIPGSEPDINFPPEAVDELGVPFWIEEDNTIFDDNFFSVVIKPDGNISACTTHGIAVGTTSPLQIDYQTYKNDLDHSGDVQIVEGSSYYIRHNGIWVGVPCTPSADIFFHRNIFYGNVGGAIARWWPALTRFAKMFNQSNYKKVLYTSDLNKAFFLSSTGGLWRLKKTKGDVVLFRIRVDNPLTAKVSYKIEKGTTSVYEFLEKIMGALSDSFYAMSDGQANYFCIHVPSIHFWGIYGSVDKELREMIDEGKSAGLNLDGE